MTTPILVDQPTAAPTRKVAAVGITGLIAPVVAAGIISLYPDLSEACSEEAGLALTILGFGLAQGAAQTLAGYFKRNSVRAV